MTIQQENFAPLSRDSLYRQLVESINAGNLKTIEVVDVVNSILVDVGELSTLQTTVKTSIVNAINELVQDYTIPSEFQTNLGVISLLDTINKESLVSAVNEVHADLGDISQLQTSSRDSVVESLNEVLSTFASIGNLESLQTNSRDNVVSAINELQTKQGGTALSTTAKNVSGAINELKGRADSTFNGSFANLSGKPTTITGYGITDSSVARSQLGLGTIATQNATNLSVENLTVSVAATLNSLTITGTLSINNLTAQGLLSGGIISTTSAAQEGTVNNKIMTPVRTAEAIAAQVPSIVTTVSSQLTNGSIGSIVVRVGSIAWIPSDVNGPTIESNLTGIYRALQTPSEAVIGGNSIFVGTYVKISS